MLTPEFIESLPKAEMHLHLEGAIPWQMVRNAAGKPLPEIPAWCEDSFRYTDFDQFTGTMQLGNQCVLTDARSYHNVARHVFRDLADQNARYVEISFGANLLARRNLTVAEVTRAIREAAPPDLRVAVFAAFNRGQTHLLDDPLVVEIMEGGVDGIDLHGKEVPHSALPYAEIFEMARQNGLMCKAHAGEMDGAQSVWDACGVLNVRRLEHGTRAVEDPALVDYLLREGVTLDMCPMSNLKLRVVDSLASHPLKYYFDLGIPVTVNTDDPTYFGYSLTDELYLLVTDMGFSPADVAEIEKNAFRAAKLPDDVRESILAEIDALVEAVKV